VTVFAVTYAVSSPVLATHASNVALSLNASTSYLGQDIGAFLGALVLNIGSLDSLGWTGALCSLLSLAVLAVGTRSQGPETALEG